MYYHSRELQKQIEGHVTEARLQAMVFYQTYLRTHRQLSELARQYNHSPSENWLQENATTIAHRVVTSKHSSERQRIGRNFRIGVALRQLSVLLR